MHLKKKQAASWVISYFPCLWHRDTQRLNKIFSKAQEKENTKSVIILVTSYPQPGRHQKAKAPLSHVIHSQGMALGPSNAFWHTFLTFHCHISLGHISLLPPQAAWEEAPRVLLLPSCSVQINKCMLKAFCVRHCARSRGDKGESVSFFSHWVQ